MHDEKPVEIDTRCGEGGRVERTFGPAGDSMRAARPPLVVAVASSLAARAERPDPGGPSSVATIPRGKPPPSARSRSPRPLRTTASSARVNASGEAARWTVDKAARSPSRAARRASSGSRDAMGSPC